VTGSAGQLCTKPGLAFIPRGGQAIVDGMVARARDAAAQPLLSERIHRSFLEIRHGLVTDGAARELVAPSAGAVGSTMTPGVLEIDATDVTPAVAEEAFGPLVVIVRYDSIDEIATALESLPDSLTATVHAEDDETDVLRALVDDLRDRAGRIVINGYPTGVRVSWAQHHGGPWPATNTQHTSVGVTAMRRFMRPLAWQNASQSLLPRELRDDETSLPRRVDGVLRTAFTLAE
jgi:NADP-dependent aldehyde dehydrogenase